MSSVQGANGASSAIQQWQYLQALASTESAKPPSTGSSPTATAFDPFAGLGGDPAQSSGGSGGQTQPFSLEAMSALINAQAQASGTNGMSTHQQKVFGKLDGDSDGSVTKAELDKAFGADNKAASDYVMKKLDNDGDGAISQSEFAAGTTKGAHHRHMHAGPPPDGKDGKDPLSQLLQAAGASSTSTSNSDGSSTTTITYADGSKVSMTSAASSASNDNSTGSKSFSQSNLLEQLIKLQAQLTNSATATSSTTA